MFRNAFIIILSASSLVAGHGKPVVFQGDVGGNGTALGIQGAVVAATGPNSKTELDTTVFGSTKPLSDGMGQTTGTGKVKSAMISKAMSLSGDVLPQVSPGGSISGTFHVVTSDGCGSVKAVLDPTATGQFSQGTLLTTTQDVPGNNGNCPRSITKKSFVRDRLERFGMIQRRATNVNMDFPVAFTVPAGTTCSGTVGNVKNVCFVKMANTNRAGPFGGVVPIQMGGNTTGVVTARAAVPATPPNGAVRRRACKFSA